jgi:excisionase family DNA binding protein
MALLSTTPRTYLTSQEAAEYLGVTDRAMIEWRRRGGGPPYVRLGGSRSGRVRYDVREIDAWMRAQTHAHTAAEAAA